MLAVAAAISSMMVVTVFALTKSATSAQRTFWVGAPPVTQGSRMMWNEATITIYDSAVAYVRSDVTIFSTGTSFPVGDLFVDPFIQEQKPNGTYETIYWNPYAALNGYATLQFTHQTIKYYQTGNLHGNFRAVGNTGAIWNNDVKYAETYYTSGVQF